MEARHLGLDRGFPQRVEVRRARVEVALACEQSPGDDESARPADRVVLVQCRLREVFACREDALEQPLGALSEHAGELADQGVQGTWGLADQGFMGGQQACLG